MCAGIITVFLNNQLWNVVFQHGENSWRNSLFHASVPLLVTAIILVTTIPFLILNLPKVGMFFFFLISIFSSYFAAKYGIILDKTVAKSTFDTSYGEASQYLNWDLAVWNISSLVLVIVAFKYVSLKKQTFLSRTVDGLKIMTGVFILVSALGFVFYKDYAAFLRNNRQVRHMVNPVSPVYEIARYWKQRVSPKRQTFAPIGLNATYAADSSRKKLIVLVLGETARADHFSLNGYTRNLTNPLLRHRKIVSFPHVVSCGTATAVSVPCIFSDLGRDKFDSDAAEARGNLLDVIQRVGYKVSWIDNNTGCQGVCERVNNVDMEKYKNPKICQRGTCFDEILVDALKDVVESSQDQFVVLHMLGSHGPSYYLRYPNEFKHFRPSCDTSELNTCTQEQVINSYDNTILYTDYVLEKTIQFLESQALTRDTAFIYVSDHGESLGERGIYLHSLPYMLAPEQQKVVPMVLWIGNGFKNKLPMSDLLKSGQSPCFVSHDNVFPTVLGLLDIQTAEYNPDKDLFEMDMQTCRRRFTHQ